MAVLATVDPTTSRVRRLASSAPFAVVVSLLFTAVFTLYFAVLRHAPAASLLYNAPIAAPFFAFFLDRMAPRRAALRTGLVDLAMIALALLRVFAPPLPYASGHTI